MHLYRQFIYRQFINEPTRALIAITASHPRHKGFSLIELVVVVAIIAILASVAFPSYQDSVRKGRRADAQGFLFDIASRQERYFNDNNRYATDLTLLGFASAANVISPEKHYKVSVQSATAGCPISHCFSLVAQPESHQSADGALTLDSLGQKSPIEKW